MAKKPRYIWTSGGVGIKDKKSPSGYREVSPKEFIEDILCCGRLCMNCDNQLSAPGGGYGDDILNIFNLLNAPKPMSPVVRFADSTAGETISTETPPEGCCIINPQLFVNGVLQLEDSTYTVDENPEGMITLTATSIWGTPGDNDILVLHYGISCS